MDEHHRPNVLVTPPVIWKETTDKFSCKKYHCKIKTKISPESMHYILKCILKKSFYISGEKIKSNVLCNVTYCGLNFNLCYLSHYMLCFINTDP